MSRSSRRSSSSPSSPSSSPSSRPGKALRIGILVGGKLVEERLMRTPATVSVGQSARNTLSIPLPDLPRVWELFIEHRGGYTLRLGDGMHARVALGGGAVRALAEREQLTLEPTARGKVVMGTTTVLFQFVVAPPLAPRAMLPASVRGRLLDRVDLRLAGILGVSLLAHGVVVGWVQAQDTPRRPEAEEAVQYFHGRLVNYPELTQPRDTGTPTGVTPDPADPADPTGPAADPARPTPPATPRDPAAEAEARARQEAQARGAIALIGARSPKDGRFTDVTGGVNPGGDLRAGVDRAAEDGRGLAVVGKTPGPGGVRGPATGEIGVGTGPNVAGPGRDGGGRDVRVGEATIEVDTTIGKPAGGDDGGLSAESVFEKIKKVYSGQIQKCYQDALKSDGSLEGRVEVTFTIGPAGTVTEVDVDGFDGRVDACIGALARAWRFEKPPQGAASFQFPLSFKPAR